MAINAYYHVTAAGAGAKDGSDWDNAFDEPAFETHLEGALVAGDVHFVMDGAYTSDSTIDFSGTPGTATSPIVIIGVKSGTTNVGANVVYADWSRAPADRPAWDFQGFYLFTGLFVIVRNIDFTGTGARVIWLGGNSLLENSKVVNTSAVAGNDCIANQASEVRYINNEINSNSGYGILTFTAHVLFNYIYDCDQATYGALDLNSGSNSIAFNIFDTCAQGIDSESRDFDLVLNNTFYETDVGVDETDGDTWSCINNIMEGNNSDGFKWTTQTDSNFFWKNHGDDVRCNDMWDLVDTTTVFQDYEVSTGDPVFDVPGADFALQNTSPNLDNGMSIILGVG